MPTEPPPPPPPPLMEAVLAVLNYGYTVAHCAEEPSKYPNPAAVASCFRAHLDTLGALYEDAKPPSTTTPSTKALPHP